MFFLCVYLFFPSVFAYETTSTKLNRSENSDIFNLPINITSVPNNASTGTNDSNTISTQRITQPSQTQKIERILETPASLNNTRKASNKTGGLENFKPSPQLETYYEYNKFPVVPAFPEAKTFGGLSGPGFATNTWNEKPATEVSWSSSQGIQSSWYENSKNQNTWGQNLQTNPNPSTEQPWTSRVKFPTSTIPTENPYHYVTNDEKISSYHPPVTFTTTTESFSFNKPVETSNRKPPLSLWQKLMGHNVNNVNNNAVAVQKTFSDYNLMEKPPHYGAPVKEYEHEISSYGSPNPLAKIIKFLTAVIPIGLFISALTPTVITVTATNDTQSRYRADDPKHREIVHRLASSLKYAEQLRSCEDKVLCELLVTASISKNSEEHIKNLLDTFVEHEDLQSKKEDLLKIFNAVRTEDCSTIVCKSTNNPS